MQSASGEALPPPDPREGVLSQVVLALLQEKHLKRQAIDDKVSQLAFDQYLERLDPGKMFLLQSDVDRLAVHRDAIDDQLRSGQLDLAREGQAIFHKRLGEVQKLVTEILAKPLDHSDEEWLETDPEKLKVAASSAELRDRWRRRLELEVLERVARMEDRLETLAKAEADGKSPDDDKAKDEDEEEDEDEDGDGIPPMSAEEIPDTAEGRAQKAREDLAKSYAGRFARLASPDPIDAASSLVNAVASIYDPHTNYLPPPDKANFDIHMSGQLEGIGAVLREDDHYIRVVEVVPGGASWRQGDLEAGDLILSVEQKGKAPVDVADMRIDEVVGMIRGPKGTVVTLVVRKPTDEEKIISITRDVVEIEAAFARGAILRQGSKKGFGYIYLPSFYGGNGAGDRTAAKDIHRLLRAMGKHNLAGVIVDMRGNGGGLLGDAVDMTGLFIEKGPVVQTQMSDGTREVLNDQLPGVDFERPVVVMVDRFSASASEIVAGALQDYGRAIVVGTGPTHGKGTVQVLADLDQMARMQNLGALKLTVQQFFRVNGASTQWKGVVPDILLPDPAGGLESGERHLDHSIPWSRIDAVDYGKWKKSWDVAKLAAQSKQRVESNPVFGKVEARAKLLDARRDETRVPLSHTAWTELRKQRKAMLEAVSTDFDEGPARFKLEVVDYDGKAKPLARPGGKSGDPLATWKKSLVRDPWVEEALHILGDMTR